MGEIVINRCPKATFFSAQGIAEYAKRKGVDPKTVDGLTVDRTDPVLIAMMREHPSLYAGYCAHIRILPEPSFKWRIVRRGNFEWIAPDA